MLLNPIRFYKKVKKYIECQKKIKRLKEYGVNVSIKFKDIHNY